MSKLEEKGYLSEIRSGNNFEYVLADNSYFIDTDYRVMQNSGNEIFVKAMKILRNGKTDLYYLTEDMKSLGEFQGAKPETILSIMTGILEAITKARENGFLNCQNVDFSKEKIFVDPNTCKVKLTYLPLSVKEWDSLEAFEEGVRVELVAIINSLAKESNEALELFVKDICSRTLNLSDVYKRLCSNQFSSKGQTPVVASETVIINRIKLVSSDPSHKVEILIDADSTYIGKKEELVDKAITFNTAISRKHCRIVKEHEKFYVMDENSANGTFVNNNRVMPGDKYPLNRGDVLRLANSDFIVM